MPKPEKTSEVMFADTIKVVRQGLMPPMVFIDGAPFPFVLQGDVVAPVNGHEFPSVTLTITCERVLVVNDRLGKVERDERESRKLSEEAARLEKDGESGE